MHEALLAEAALPAPATILGLAMQPYSLGHELWLIRQGSPFVLGGEVTKAKLYEAVLICSETWEGARRMNRDWLMPAKLMLWRWRTRNELVPLASQDFQYYRERGCLCVPINPPKPGQVTVRPPGSPFLVRLKNFLVEHNRLTQAQAWDYPLGLAMIERAAYFEEKECLEVENELDVRTREFAEANDARLKVFMDGGMSEQEAWAKLLQEGLSCPA